MKSTGIVRKLDELGRITLPVELRRAMNIKEKDQLEISVDGNKVILEKHEEKAAIACPHCGAAENLIKDGDSAICPDCLDAFICRLEG